MRQNTPDQTNRRRAVLEVNARFYAAFRAGDADGMNTLWSRQEPIAVQHPASGHIQGRDAVVESWHKILMAPPEIGFTVHSLLEDGDKWSVICIERIGRRGFRMVNVFRVEQTGCKMIYHGPIPEPRFRH